MATPAEAGVPFVDPDIGDRESTYSLPANRNKRSVTVDLEPADGGEDLWRRLCDGLGIDAGAPDFAGTGW